MDKSEIIRNIKVAGTSYKNRSDNIKKLNAMSKLMLIREHENIHDFNAIKVVADCYKEGEFEDLGYIPAMTALWLATAIDGGEKYEPRIKKIELSDDKNISLILDLMPVD